jgi:isoamylase
MTQVWPGSAYPLGATYDGTGTNFAIFSEVAEKVELCLFDDDGNEERIRLPEMDGYVWHAFLPGIHPGQKYGFRVHGPYDPARGLRCNPNKLLLDPYAKAIDGQIEWDPSVFGYDFETKERNDEDSAAHMPKSVVVNPYFDWGVDRPPKTPYNKTVIYEAHVKGLTMTNPRIPEELRGTYAGVAHPATIEHLQELGITAIELMPVHQFVQDDTLQQKGLRNYWGYNTIGFFAPHNEYASNTTAGQHVQEFKGMVRALHEAGIEVILDVVYNHTAEGNHLGPTLSFKGIDNRAYYKLVEGDEQYYMDYTGTGNTLNVRTPQALQLIMDSLRYWVTEMHVDGFRFDLASALARELHAVDRLATFFDLVHQDPVVSQVKLIAEPWDVGEGGYQVGNFPALWTEWNGKYRDTVRDFWRGEGDTVGEFASRITGSADLYQHSGRRPVASINFVTAHDGFTLNDLVSYNEKHNEANGENNNDGPGDPPAAGAATAQLHRHPHAQPGRAHAPARRRARADPAGQQQRLRAGLPADLDRLGAHRRGAARVHQGGDPAPVRAPHLPPPTVLPRPAGAPRTRRAGPGHRLAHPRGRADDRRGLGCRLRQVARRLPQRRGHPGDGRARRVRHRRPLLPGLQRLARADRVHAAR